MVLQINYNSYFNYIYHKSETRGRIERLKFTADGTST